VVAIFAPLIAPHNPLAQTFPPSQSPVRDHLFGTDELGRDVFSRVIYGSRISLPIALLLVLAATIGGSIGALAATSAASSTGRRCARRSRLRVPAIILAMVVRAVLGRGLQNAALAIVVVAWPAYARVVRGLVLSVGDSEYVQSARLLGASRARRSSATSCPNVAGPCSCSRRSTWRPRSCCSRASRSSGSARSRRRRSGARWSPTARSTSSGGGSARSPASRSSQPVLGLQLPRRQPARRARPPDRGARGTQE
jgi:hypothetical protein